MSIHNLPRRWTGRASLLPAAIAVVLALGAASATAAAAQTTQARGASTRRADCPWLNQSLSVQARVRMLLAKMTLSDKISEVEGHGTSEPYVFYEAAQPALCIPALGLEDGPNGVGDGLTGVTQLPAGVSLAATFDPQLARQYGEVVGSEEWGKGAAVNLGPTVNIDRDPRWGRSFESFTEDPFLNAALAVSEIDGVQSTGEMSQVKHYAVYNQETNRNTPADDVIISNRALHEIYLPAFQQSVTQAHVASVMCSYSVINGNFACENKYLEKTTLKQRWHFPGFVTSDYGALHSTSGAVDGTDMEQPFNTYFGTALQTDIQNGTIPVSVLNDMVSRILREMFRFSLFNTRRPAPPAAWSPRPAHQAVSHRGRRGGHGAAQERRRHAAAVGQQRRHHRGHRAVGVGLAHLRRRRQRPRGPAVHGDAAAGPHRRGGRGHQRHLSAGPAHRHQPAGHPVLGAVARLQPDPVRRQLLRHADRAGDRHLRARARRTRAAATPPPRLSVNGKEILNNPGTPPVSTYSASVRLQAGHTYADQDQRRLLRLHLGDAVGAGARASARRRPRPSRRATAVVVVSDDTETEAADRPDLNLPSAQNELISAVARANPHTVVVVDAGRAGGHAVAEPGGLGRGRLVPGREQRHRAGQRAVRDHRPGGHLPVTFPQSLAQVPAHTARQFPGVNGKVHYSEGIDVGYRWYDARNLAPMFPFGYGLSYTRFGFSHLRIDPAGRDGGRHGQVRVTARVTNTGAVAGSDVAQLYLDDPPAAGEPPRQLKGFQRVDLQPGQSTEVSFVLDQHDLSYWKQSANGWVIPPGVFRAYVGDSSALAGLPLQGAFALGRPALAGASHP